MEYAKDILLNVKYRGIESIRASIRKLINFIIFLRSIIKKCTRSILNLVKHNKIICSVGVILVVLIVSDLVLLDLFLKLFSTLY